MVPATCAQIRQHGQCSFKVGPFGKAHGQQVPAALGCVFFLKPPSPLHQNSLTDTLILERWLIGDNACDARRRYGCLYVDLRVKKPGIENLSEIVWKQTLRGIQLIANLLW